MISSDAITEGYRTQVNYISMLADTRGVKEIRQTYKQVKQVNKYIKAIKYEKEKNL